MLPSWKIQIVMTLHDVVVEKLKKFDDSAIGKIRESWQSADTPKLAMSTSLLMIITKKILKKIKVMKKYHLLVLVNG